jgi:DDE family transposase
MFPKSTVLRLVPASMPGAFFGRYRLMAIDGTVFNTPDTAANATAFGRSSNQSGPGAYLQARCVQLAECGIHAVVGLEIDRYDISEVHGAHHLLEEVGPNMLVMVDAGITSGGFVEHARQRGAHVLFALETGVWEQLRHQRRLADGSMLAWVGPTRPGHAQYPLRRGMWVRILSYRVTDERLGEPGQVYSLVTILLNPRVAPALELIALYHERWEIEVVIDEIKTHEHAQRKVLRSKTPEGVRQELYGIYLAHYAVRVLLAHAEVAAELDPDRLSFSEGLFELTEMISLALTDGGQKRRPSRYWSACGTGWPSMSCQPVVCASTAGRSSRFTISTNPRSARSLHLSPLILMSSFSILLTCLILSPLSFLWEGLK